MTRLLRGLSLLSALLLAGLIYYLSDQPMVAIPQVFDYQDKALHVAAYFVLGFLGLGAMRAGIHGYSIGQAGLAFLITGLYGVLDEYHQSFVPGRHATISDVVADLTGALLGVGVLFLLVRRYARRTAAVV
ncbi:MAG: VanZ family protein [Thiohalobacterales bacterium]|nr:VanZ family protein [Thiohalobacterales bacterium]